VSQSRIKKFAKTAALKASVSALAPELIAANLSHIHESALAADVARDQHERQHAHGARAPPTNRTNVYADKAKALQSAGVPAVRLLDKATVMAIAGASFPTIWKMMRDGRFPRSRIFGGRSMWLSNEIDAWLANLPRRPLKGDAAVAT
jgi:predicted DNA-binding transcriptional regulator AlpA